MGTLGSGRYAPYAQRPHGRFVHHVEGHKPSAGERTVKNWFEGKNGPNGDNLIELIRHSDEVLEAVLLMAGREDILQGKLLVDARDELVEMIEIIDRLRPEAFDEEGSEKP